MHLALKSHLFTRTIKDWNLPGLSIVIVKGGKPALPLSACTGIYSDPLYGHIEYFSERHK